MLTTAQTRLVGAVPPMGGLMCLDCLKFCMEDQWYEDHPGTDDDAPEFSLGDMRDWLAKGRQSDEGWVPVIEHTLQKEWNMDGDGAWCDECGALMAAPYCYDCGATEELGLYELGWDEHNFCHECAIMRGFIEDDVADLYAADDELEEED